jgi:hypothetical protein
MNKSYRNLTIKLAPDGRYDVYEGYEMIAYNFESLTLAQNWIDNVFYGKD